MTIGTNGSWNLQALLRRWSVMSVGAMEHAGVGVRFFRWSTGKCMSDMGIKITKYYIPTANDERCLMHYFMLYVDSVWIKPAVFTDLDAMLNLNEMNSPVKANQWMHGVWPLVVKLRVVIINVLLLRLLWCWISVTHASLGLHFSPRADSMCVVRCPP